MTKLGFPAVKHEGGLGNPMNFSFFDDVIKLYSKKQVYLYADVELSVSVQYWQFTRK